MKLSKKTDDIVSKWINWKALVQWLPPASVQAQQHKETNK